MYDINKTKQILSHYFPKMSIKYLIHVIYMPWIILVYLFSALIPKSTINEIYIYIFLMTFFFFFYSYYSYIFLLIYLRIST